MMPRPHPETHENMKTTAEGVYLPEGHLILRAKSQELRAILIVEKIGKMIYNNISKN
jgi:hypothetical protein